MTPRQSSDSDTPEPGTNGSIAPLITTLAVITMRPGGETFDESTRKRARIGGDHNECGEDNHDECREGEVADALSASDPDLKPFVELPFRGEHKKAVSAISFAPINTTKVLCATSSADGSARIWDIDEAVNCGAKNALASESPVQIQPKSVLYGHNGKGINDITWSSSGEYAATASDDKTGRIWDVEKSTALIELKGHNNFVFTCKFNPRSSLIATGSFDETVKLWDVRTGDCVSTIVAHSNPVTAVDFNTDGTCIASGSYDGKEKTAQYLLRNSNVYLKVWFASGTQQPGSASKPFMQS